MSEPNKKTHNAFENCKALSSKDKAFVIPSNVKDIGQEAFKNVEWIHYEGSADISKCGALKVTTKPEELSNGFNNRDLFSENNPPSDDSTGEGKTVPKEQKKDLISDFKDGWNNMFNKGKNIDNKQGSTSPQSTRQQINQQTVSPTYQQSAIQRTQNQYPSTSISSDPEPINTLEQLSNQLSSARADIVKLKKEKTELEQHKIKQEALLNKAHKQIDEANSNAQKYLDDYNKIKKEYDGFLKELQNDLDEKEKEIINLEGQIEAKQEIINTKEKDIKTKQSEIDKLEKDLKASRDIAPVISPIMENFIGKLVDVIDKKANDIAEVKAVTQTTNLAKILVNDKIKQIENDNSKKQTMIDSLLGQVGEKKLEADRLKEKLDEAEAENKKLEQDFEEAKIKSGEEHAKQLEAKDKELKEANDKVTALQVDNKTLFEQNKVLTENNRILGEKNSDKKQKITELELQLNQLQTKHAEELAKKDEELQASLSNSSEASKKLLEDQKAKFDEEKSKLQADNQTLSNANNDLQKEKEKVEKEFESHQSLYADFDNLYKYYKLLPEGLKLNLQNLFGKEDSVVSLVFNITKSRNIESFWQFICDRIDRDELPEQIDKLKNIFSIAFKLLQVADPNYVLIDTKLEDGWSNIFMRKKLGSPQNGVVKEVYLKGIKYQANNRIIKQSLVLLG